MLPLGWAPWPGVLQAVDGRDAGAARDMVRRPRARAVSSAGLHRACRNADVRTIAAAIQRTAAHPLVCQAAVPPAREGCGMNARRRQHPKANKPRALRMGGCRSRTRTHSGDWPSAPAGHMSVRSARNDLCAARSQWATAHCLEAERSLPGRGGDGRGARRPTKRQYG